MATARRPIRDNAWLRKRYDAYNARFFGGKLTADVRWGIEGKMGSNAGFCTWGRFPNIRLNPRIWSGIARNGGSVAEFDREVLSVLLHEMIHAEQMLLKRAGTVATLRRARDGDCLHHDRWFGSRARELTILSGIKVTTYHYLKLGRTPYATLDKEAGVRMSLAPAVKSVPSWKRRRPLATGDA